MNIRGTDPAGLAAVTDLFAVGLPAKDSGNDDFHRALQTGSPPSSAGSSSSTQRESQVDSAHSQQDDADDDVKDEARAPEAKELSAEPQDTAVEPTMELVDDQVPSHADELTEEEQAARDLAAESLIAVSQMHSTRQTPQPVPKPEGELQLVERNGLEAEVAQAADQVTPVVDEAPIPLPQLVEGPVVSTDESKSKLVEVTAEEPAIAGVTELTIEVEATNGQMAEGGIGVLPSAVLKETKPSTKVEKEEVKASSVSKRAVEEPSEPTSAKVQSAEIDASSDAPTSRRRSDKREERGAAGIAEMLPVHQADLQAIPVDLATTLPADVSTAAEAPAATSAVGVTANVDANSLRSPDPSPANPLVNVQGTNHLSQRLPGHALVRGATPANGESTPLHVDAARFLQRVAKAFESAQERGGEVRLRLSPPELGALRVEVSMQDQGLVARVEAETAEARAVLMEHLPVLRERLAEQGLKLERFDVDLSQRQPEGQTSGDMSDRSSQRQPGHAQQVPRSLQPQREVASERPGTAAAAAHWTDRQLNVIV
jgi:flagellar hook-length control protein FliK